MKKNIAIFAGVRALCRCCISLRYILDESVFAFILAGNLVNFKVFKDKQLHSSPGLVYRAFCTVSIRVWSIGYLNTGLPEPPADKRSAPHFFYILTMSLGRDI